MPTRLERHVAQSQRATRARRRRYLWMGAASAAVVAIIVAVVASGTLNRAPSTVAAQAATADAVCGPVQSFPVQSRDHIQPGQSHPPYSSNPPTSGWHWPNPQDWGIYTTPQVQEQLVHNLEHGGVIVQYSQLSAANVQRLTSLVQSDPHHMILAPYPGLPAGERVAITAWTYLQTCSGVDENAMRTFIGAHRDHAPEQVP